MSTPFSNLTEDGADQIAKYLRFFRQKKDGLVRVITRECEDAKRDKLESDEHMYTKEDMEDFADFITSSVRSHIIADLGSIINMGALSVSQLLGDAQDKGIDLNLETAAVENHALLEAVDKMNLDAIPVSKRRGLGTLTSMKDEQRAMKDAQEALEELNKKLSEDNSSLTRKLAIMRRTKAEGKESNEELEDALREAKEENDKRVRDTNQFVQMKKLMQNQAANIRDLRKRLQRYEPDDASDGKEIEEDD